MFKKKLIWLIYLAFLLVILAVLAATTFYSFESFRKPYREQVRRELNMLARVSAELFSRRLEPSQYGELDHLCKELGKGGAGHARLTVILPSGKVVGDSDEDPAVMEDHSRRPEIVEAMETGYGSSERFSATLGKRMMYLAVPVRADPNGEPVAIVRAALPVTAVDHALRSVYEKLLWGGLAIAVVAAFLSLVISRRISRPIVQMRHVAERFARGELDVRVPIPASVELAALAGALNEMATQLHDRIKTITEQRNELEAVLSSMAEGVLAVDMAGRIVSANKAAAGFLNIDPAKAHGRHVEEIVRDADLQQFVRRTLEDRTPAEADISMPVHGQRHFRLHGAGLADAHGRRRGAVIVITDMTRMRQLEDLRRDFVANVSHELKTPVTSIQGFVEALMDKSVGDPAQIDRYLAIIAKHSLRLNAIIDDLLSLSRLDQEGRHLALCLERTRIRPVLEAAVEISGIKAQQKQIAIELACDDQLEATINAPLLEEALVNLIDNAIKYSRSGSRISISAELRDNQVAIAVRDSGCGIAPEHIGRIFERFYVVDKGRSRRLGGTGLGLAIVKHIVQVHQGQVSVESTPGSGSIFTILLPNK